MLRHIHMITQGIKIITSRNTINPLCGWHKKIVTTLATIIVPRKCLIKDLSIINTSHGKNFYPKYLIDEKEWERILLNFFHLLPSNLLSFSEVFKVIPYRVES